MLDARGGEALRAAAQELSPKTQVVAVTGDVAEEAHRAELVEAARALGGPDLLVNNASLLGPSPQPKLADYPLDDFRAVFEVNVTAPLALIQLALPLLTQSPQGRILNVTSDAGVEGYKGWGGYGSSKAALEQLSKVLAAEHPELQVWWVDPGDMNTQMLQEAYPDQDVSDRPSPEESVPGILRLIDDDAPSGRYQAGRSEAGG